MAGGKGSEPAGSAEFLDSFEVSSPDLDQAAIAKAHLYEGPAIGPADAPVTIAIFQDPVCKYCTMALANLAPTLEANAGKVRLVFKQFPMPNHTNADLAAEAMLAAQAQGKFEPLHAALVANPTALARENLIAYATEAKLDVDRFTKDLDAHTYAAAVKADTQTANDLHVTGTPTVFINGKRLVGAQPSATFKTEIESALASAK
jgi:protein-disulfide isomerase